MIRLALLAIALLASSTEAANVGESLGFVTLSVLAAIAAAVQGNFLK